MDDQFSIESYGDAVMHPGIFHVKIPSGNWEWPFLVDFPIKNGDFP